MQNQNPMRLLADDVTFPTENFSDVAPYVPEDTSANEISAFLFECGGIFLTADDWGNVILWTPRYEIGRPTRNQLLAASVLREVPIEEVTDLDLFLVGGAKPTTFVHNSSPFDN